MAQKKVVILGGGIAGLCAAHALSQVNLRVGGAETFEIHVYDRASNYGGKAASQIPDNGRPGEHGFRFFPRFYRHIIRTLQEIAHPSGGTVFDALHPGRKVLVIHRGNHVTIDRSGGLISNLPDALRGRFDPLGVNWFEAFAYGRRILKFWTSCDERREFDLDDVPWTEYLGIGTGAYDRDTERLLVSVPSSLSAMKAETGSSRTIGLATLRMALDFSSPSDTPDNVGPDDAILGGPTDVAWIDPWIVQLKSNDVTFHGGAPLESFVFDAARGVLAGVVCGGSRIEADYFVAALPLEVMDGLITNAMARYDVGLANVRRLKQRLKPLADMVGVQLFLKRQVPLCEGHVFYVDTEWALTSVSQGQFWERTHPEVLASLSGVEDVMSVIISEWDTKGRHEFDVDGVPTKKTAHECTSGLELITEVIAQIRGELGDDSLTEDDVVGFHIDSGIKLAGSAEFENQTPLFVHPIRSYKLRPNAELRIRNLFLASDYVRSHTDLATMEGADESARTAGRAICRDTGVARHHWPQLFQLDEGQEPAKRADFVLWTAGLPHIMDMSPLDILRAPARLRDFGIGAQPPTDKFAERAFVSRHGITPDEADECTSLFVGAKDLAGKPAHKEQLAAWIELLGGGEKAGPHLV